MKPARPSSVESDLELVSSMLETITDLTRAGYLNEGRGAMVVDLSQSPEVNGGYLSISRLLVELGVIPDKTLEQTLQAYDPAAEFVVIVRRADRSLHGYVLSY
jgi:SOS response regulatory protein OraA/RecX